MRLPSSPEEAFEETERVSSWIRKRYPDACVNESYSSLIAFFTWVSNHIRWLVDN